jgi:hypothetical protein
MGENHPRQGGWGIFQYPLYQPTALCSLLLCRAGMYQNILKRVIYIFRLELKIDSKLLLCRLPVLFFIVKTILAFSDIPSV